MNSCPWICVIGNTWVPNGPQSCPAEEHCDIPTKRGASGDTTETACLA